MAKKAEQKWVVTKRWRKLSRKEQIEEVRREMKVQSATNKSVATELGTTPGAVAGIRWKNDIPSTNVPRGAAAKTAGDGPEPLIKLAVSEATQCKHRDSDKHRCGREREPGSDFCIKHGK